MAAQAANAARGADRPGRPQFSDRHGTLYAQVATVIRQRIRSGLWAPGRQIPTLEELESEFAVARVTLRQALSLLEAEGLIWRGRGRGTFVTDKAGLEWFKLETSRDQLVHSLEGNWSRPIAVADAVPPPRLDPGDGEAVPAYRHMRRVHGAGASAYALVDIHLDHALYARAPRRFDTEMIIPVIDSLPGVEIADIRQTLTIGTADREAAEHLDVPIGSPVGIMRKAVRDGAGRAVYVGVVTYRGDMVRLEISLADRRQQASRG
jgi:GntR family transcriptional regulator